MSDSTVVSTTVLFFDGMCHLCHGSVNFLLDHRVAGKVQFAPLQSEIARKLLQPHGFDPTTLKSILLLDGRTVFEADEAVLRVCSYLPGAWSWLRFLRFIPRFVRRPVYFYIAKRRYKWFGKYESCRLPNPSTQGRFIE